MHDLRTQLIDPGTVVDGDAKPQLGNAAVSDLQAGGRSRRHVRKGEQHPHLFRQATARAKPRHDDERIEEVDDFVAVTGAIRHDIGGDRAYFAPRHRDEIAKLT
jgi:hypothetical protein